MFQVTEVYCCFFGLAALSLSLICIDGRSSMNFSVLVGVPLVVPNMTTVASFCILSSFSRFAGAIFVTRCLSSVMLKTTVTHISSRWRCSVPFGALASSTDRPLLHFCAVVSTGSPWKWISRYFRRFVRWTTAPSNVTTVIALPAALLSRVHYNVYALLELMNRKYPSDTLSSCCCTALAASSVSLDVLYMNQSYDNVSTLLGPV